MSMTDENLINLLTIRNGNIPYVVQSERYASSGDFVLIFFARDYLFFYFDVSSTPTARKMAARFFLHGDHLPKVVLSGTPFLSPVLYDRMYLDSVQYGNLLHVFTNANSGGCGGSVVELRTPEREVQGSNPSTAV